MISSITWLIMLAVFSGLSMNLILQCGLGLKRIAFDESIGKERLLAGSGFFFATVMVLWLIFLFLRSVLFLGLWEYAALFPVSSLVFSVFEYLANRFIYKKTARRKIILLGDPLAGGALAGAALFVMLNVAGNFFEAFILSLGFSFSLILVFVVVGEIRRRAQMEAVPRWLRGGPLALIALGLLSLVFASAALMLFRGWGVR